MQTYSFEEARKTTGRIEGWLTEGEGAFLYNVSKAVPKSKAIVEIGSWKGKSTVWLGFGSKAGSGARIYAIDPHKTYFQTGRFSGNREDVCGGAQAPKSGGTSKSLREFRKNVKMAGVAGIVVPIVKTSEEACRKWKMGRKIAFLWIDGAHDYENVKKDFLIWSPRLVDGGMIAFHDTIVEGPKKVVEKYVFRSGNFTKTGFVDSIVFATKVKRNSSADRVRNTYVFFLRNFYLFLSGLKLPAGLRSFGKKFIQSIA